MDDYAQKYAPPPPTHHRLFDADATLLCNWSLMSLSSH